jgi:predicted nucleic acid-binding protein
MQAKHKGLISAIKPLMNELRSVAGFRIAEPLFQKILSQMGE